MTRKASNPWDEGDVEEGRAGYAGSEDGGRAVGVANAGSTRSGGEMFELGDEESDG
jgi:hypothetical protein